MSSAQGCQRCGTCCRQGGPALHSQDLDLIRGGRLRLDDLITVRKGELAFQPLAACPEPVTHEFLKMKGQKGTWCCAFYDEIAKGCLRYEHRPLTCRLLDCTDTGPLLDIAGQDLLTRFDCMDQNDPLLLLMHRHEEQCPCPDLQTVSQGLEQTASQAALLADLEHAVTLDLAFRARIVAPFHLSVDRELFAFGRPLFQLLQPLGIQAVNTPDGPRLRYRPQ